MIRRLCADLTVEQSSNTKVSPVGGKRPAAVSDRKPLTPALLAKLEDSLAHADLSALVRNQAVCAITTKDRPQPVFEEVFVAIGDLEQAVLPGVSLMSDPWLFRHLTTVLDTRILTQLVDVIGESKRAFSINLNISTVLSDSFRRFDRDVSVSARGRLLVELQWLDVFRDLNTYGFARDFLHERGYKVCLDGVSHTTLPLVDRERLDIDMVKLLWSAEFGEAAEPQLLADLKARIDDVGRTRIVLTRCDTEQVLHLGRQMGISLFQGFAVDRLRADNRPLQALTKSG